MRVIIESDYELICEWVVSYIHQKIIQSNPTKEKPFILGLPTGSTPIGVYRGLIKLYQKNEISFENVVTFNMDEYVGLEPSNIQSYNYFMHDNFFNHINIPKENINLLDGLADDLEDECIRYENTIKSHKINLFLCGVGSDGHLAFNEPGSSFQSRTRVKTLCDETLNSNVIYFNNDTNAIPRLVLTVGLGTIMDAEEVLLMASGCNKAVAVKQIIEGTISTQYPSSILQMHQKSIILCDNKACSELSMKTFNYYKELQKNINIMGKVIKNPLLEKIKPFDKILVTSPHPDDDVIGMGGTLALLQEKSNVTVAYMTNGQGGLDSNSFNVRYQEASASLLALDYTKETCKYIDLPFYNTKERIVTPKDMETMTDFLEQEQPTHLFVCADRDPKTTHHQCLQIIRDSKLCKSIKYVWFYMSAWDTFDNYDIANTTVYIDPITYQKKILSIALHQSQNPPKVYPIHIEYPKNFMQVAEEKDKSSDHFNYYQERFYVVDSEKAFLATNHIIKAIEDRQSNRDCTY